MSLGTHKPIILGKNCPITITPVAEDPVTGALTAGSSAIAMTGKSKRATWRINNRTFESNVLDSNYVNRFQYLQDWTLNLSHVVWKGTAAGINPFWDVFTGQPVGTPAGGYGLAEVIVTVQAGSGPTVFHTATFIGEINDWNWDIIPEENVNEFVLMCIDTGSANPAFT